MATNENLLSKDNFAIAKKTLYIILAIILGLFITLWVWKAIQIRNIKHAYSLRENDLKQSMRVSLAETNKSFLNLLAKPYVWAVRPELMQSNYKQINLFGSDIVKEKGFVSIMVVDKNGIIISSTDKKFDGKNFAASGNPFYLTIDSTMVDLKSDSTFVTASPIMSFNSKVGTLIITYAPKKQNFLR